MEIEEYTRQKQSTLSLKGIFSTTTFILQHSLNAQRLRVNTKLVVNYFSCSAWQPAPVVMLWGKLDPKIG